MAALTKGRNTPRLEGDFKEQALGATQVFAGSILMRNGAGYLTAGATATGAVGVGVCYQDLDNSGGTAGDILVRYCPGTFRFENSGGGDEITMAHIGTVCFIVDGQTVARTAGGGTRSPAGFIDNVDAHGVWVRFDEALTRAA